MTGEALIVVGLRHLRAPLPCRERAAVPRSDLLDVLLYLRVYARLEEVAVLSTCSRVEIVVASRDPAASADKLREWLLRRAGEEAAPAVHILAGREALQHLFRVASGLDSWIVGESEILGQVKEAYHFALEHGGTGALLNKTFQRAIGAGKAIRARTGIQNGISSIGGAAALLARRIFGEGTGGQVVVFGAGQAAEAVVRHLAAKSFDRIVVANRTLERARAVAEPLGGRGVPFEEGIGLLSEAEAAIFSAACPEPLLSAGRLRPLASGRRRPLFLIDLGLPRNVDPACAGLDGVYLYTLDDLQKVVGERNSAKAAQKEEAEVLASLAAADCASDLSPRSLRTAQGIGTFPLTGRSSL